MTKQSEINWDIYWVIVLFYMSLDVWCPINILRIWKNKKCHIWNKVTLKICIQYHLDRCTKFTHLMKWTTLCLNLRFCIVSKVQIKNFLTQTTHNLQITTLRISPMTLEWSTYRILKLFRRKLRIHLGFVAVHIGKQMSN